MGLGVNLNDELNAPEPSERFHGATPKLGAPIADHVYRNAAGRDVLHVTRYKRKPDATAPTLDDGPVTRYWLWNAGLSKWEMHKGGPRPAPLWQLDMLFSHPTWPVYFFDNEEAATLFQEMLTEHSIEAVATCWAGGSPAARDIELSVLQERSLWLWPTNTSDDIARMLSIAGKLFPVLDREGFEVAFIRVPTDKPSHWGVVQASTDGWSWDDIQEFLMSNHALLSESPQTIRTDPKRLNNDPVEGIVVQGQPKSRSISAINANLSQRWREYSLALGSNGLPHNNLFNVGKIIEFHRGAYCDVWMDEFHNKIMTRETDTTRAREWSESDTLEFTRFIQDPAGVGLSKMSTGIVHEAVVLAASKQKRNEVREWLRSLRWDGRNRLEGSFPLAWGTVDTPYYRAIGRCFMMGAAARILRPGCQVDTLPVFEGPQGIFKSSALQALASEAWYDEPAYELGHHDFYQCLSGKWILEFAEMAGLSGKSAHKNNAVITRRVDTYRPSYGRIAVTYPRMCVFSASTNDPEWNDSEFGARRFWPVACGRIDLGMIKEMREQWFAEACARVDRDEKWYDIPYDALKLEHANRVPSDLWDRRIAQFLSGMNEVTLPEVAQGALDIETEKQSPQVKHRIVACLKKFGWYSVRVRDGYELKRVWRPVPGVGRTLPPALDDLPPGF